MALESLDYLVVLNYYNQHTIFQINHIRVISLVMVAIRIISIITVCKQLNLF